MHRQEKVLLSIIVVIFLAVTVVAIDPWGRMARRRDNIRQEHIKSLTAALQSYFTQNQKAPEFVHNLAFNEVYMIVAGAKASGCDDDNERCSTLVTKDSNCVDFTPLTQAAVLTEIPVSSTSQKKSPWEQGKTNNQHGIGYTVKKTAASLIIDSCENETGVEMQEVVELP